MISHTKHAFGSVVKFIEENFNLPSLHQADARADNLLDCFDFTQSVTPLSIIHTQHDARFFINEPHVMGPNDPD